MPSLSRLAELPLFLVWGRKWEKTTRKEAENSAFERKEEEAEQIKEDDEIRRELGN